jgi:hypothetical protein
MMTRIFNKSVFYLQIPSEPFMALIENKSIVEKSSISFQALTQRF